MRDAALLSLAAGLFLGALAPAARAVTFDDFAALPEVESAAIAPDARHFVTLQPVAGRRSVVIYDMAGGKCAFAPSDVKIEGVYWAASDRLLVSVGVMQIKYSLFGDYLPHEVSWMILIDATCKNPIMVLPETGGHTAGFRARVLSRLPGDDRHVLLARGKIYKLDLDTGKAIAISPTDRSRCDSSWFWLTDAAGRPRICYQVVNRDAAIFARLSGSDDWVQIYRYGWDDRDARGITFEGFADDPDVAYVITRNGGERLAAYKFDLKTKTIGALVYQNPKYDVTGYVLEPGTKKVVGVAYDTFEGGQVEWLDPAWAKLWADLSATFEKGAVDFVSFASDRKIFTVYHQGPDEPGGAYFLVDMNKPEVSRLGGMHPAIGPGDYITPQVIHYKARDGMDIPAYLTLPRAAGAGGKPALVVMPHGGPQSRDDPASYDDWQQFLAWRGYAVLQPQFRGSTGLGQTFLEAGYKQWGLKMQDDITDGVNELIAKGLVDKDRICIFGWSYGGYAALAGLTFTPDLYKCGVAGGAISDLTTMTGFVVINEGQGLDEKYYFWPKTVGDITLERPRLMATSPALNAGRIRAPLLLIHGEYDMTVPIGQSDEMAKAMEKAGRPYQYVRLQGEDHHLFRADTRRKMYEALDQFLAKYLH